MNSLYNYWYPQQQPYNNLDGMNQKLDELRNFYDSHEINDRIIQHADKIIGGAFLVTQVASRFWTSLGGSVAGFFLGIAVDRYSAEFPPQVAEIAERIQEIWANQGIRISTYAIGFILLYCSPDTTSFLTSLCVGAYSFSLITNKLPQKKEF
jgi:hypothetical protein